jgi:hypothetical protein
VVMARGEVWDVFYHLHRVAAWDQPKAGGADLALVVVRDLPQAAARIFHSLNMSIELRKIMIGLINIICLFCGNYIRRNSTQKLFWE